MSKGKGMGHGAWGAGRKRRKALVRSLSLVPAFSALARAPHLEPRALLQ